MYVPPVPDLDTLAERYLDALGVQAVEPSVDLLVRLNRAHVQRFSHDTIWMSRGRQPPVDDPVLAESLLAGEGGACIHLNWSLAWLLTHLGYAVTRHRALTQTIFDAEPHDEDGGHLVLSVDLEGRQWYVDVGLGNGMLEPVPLEEGSFEQEGGFRYALERTDGDEPGWRFLHDRRLRAITVVQFPDAPADPAEVQEVYERASIKAESPFVRNLTANRRLPDGVLMLTNDTLVRRDVGGRTIRRIESAEEWEALLREEFLLGLPEMDTAERDALWAKATQPPGGGQ